ncbi:MAG: M20/M25/M40 family metallo-hydrolase [Planctomycetota bacterium]|nr:M20/M25/M40 family metallo-hydrolase [Planctomycetota bacterium]
MRPYLALLLVVLLAPALTAQYQGAKPVPDQLKKGFDSITPEYCKTVLSYLAGEECQGRRTGTEGYQKAADYVAARFKEFGLKPVGDDRTYFQGVPFQQARVDVEKSKLTVGGSKFVCGEDVMFNPADAKVEGSVVFVTGDADAILEDSKVLLGKILVVHGETGGRSGGTTRQARKHRPVAILTVSDSVGKPLWVSSRGGGRRRSRRAQQVRGTITLEAAKRLAASCGLKKALDMPAEGATYAKATRPKRRGGGKIVVVRETAANGVPNVVGLLEGSDSRLKHEMVICGSHLDHLGVGTDGQVNYGADDDGSGSSGLVALARAFSTNGKRPRRSILFLAFCGEEMGLVGSRYYADNPIFPLKDAVCELQMDMIGRNEEFCSSNRTQETGEDNVTTTHLIGSKRISMDLHELVIAMNEHIGFTFEYDEEDVYTRSDHYSFAQKGVPISFFFSGFHKDYHRPTDTVDKINFDKVANTTKLVYLTAFEAANRKKRLRK